MVITQGILKKKLNGKRIWSPESVRSVNHVLGRLVLNKNTEKKELTEAHRQRLKELACELIMELFGTEQRVAKGQVYPSRDGILHGLPIEPGFVKVQVDTIEEGCSALQQTDEVKTLHDALGGQFIQWPRKYIKVSKKVLSHNSTSHPSCNPPSRYRTTSHRQERW